MNNLVGQSYTFECDYCHAEVAAMVDGRPGWLKCICPKCGNTNRMIQYDTVDGKVMLIPSRVGAKNNDMVRLPGIFVEREKAAKLKDIPNYSEVIRCAIDVVLCSYMDM